MNRALAHWFIDGGFIFKRDLGRRQVNKTQSNHCVNHYHIWDMQGGLVFLILKARRLVQLTSADFLTTRYYYS